MDLQSAKALADFMSREGGTVLSLLDREGRLCAIEGPHQIEISGESWGITMSSPGGGGNLAPLTLGCEQIVAIKAHVVGKRPLYFGDRTPMIEAEVSAGLRAAREEHASGRYAAAVAIGQACLALIRRELGAVHVASAQVMATIANSLRMVGRLQEACEQAEGACSLARHSLDESDPRLADVLQVRALTYADLGQLAWARIMAREVLDLRRAHGAKGTATADALATLSLIDCWRGEYEGASQLAREGLHVLARSAGPERTERTIFARLLHHDGMALGMRGQADAALPLLEESLAEHERVLGHGHPETVDCMTSLGTLCLVRGDVLRATNLYREAITLAERALGEDHYLVADCAVGLAFACRNFGTLEASLEAIALLERSRVIRRRAQERSHG